MSTTDTTDTMLLAAGGSLGLNSGDARCTLHAPTMDMDDGLGAYTEST